MEYSNIVRTAGTMFGIGTLLLLLGLMLVLKIFYIMTLQTAFSRCSEQNRKMSPRLVWLLLIPIISEIWHFIVVLNLSKSLGQEFKARGITSNLEKPGKVDGLLMCICAMYQMIPALNSITWLAAFILWIVYWVKIAEYSQKLILSETQSTQKIQALEGGIQNIVLKYIKVLRWVVTGLYMMWLLWIFYKDHQSLMLQFASLSLPVIATLLFLSVAYLWLYTIQFYLVMKTCTSQPISFFVFFRSIIFGRFFNNIAPQDGNVYQAVYLKYKFGISYTQYLSGLLCFFWIDAAINILLCAVVFGWFAPKIHIGYFSIWWILLLLILVWCIPILFNVVFRRCPFHAEWLLWLHSRISEMLTVAIHSFSRVRRLFAIIIFNLLNIVNVMVFFYLCLSDFGIIVGISSLMICLVIMKLSSYMIMLPIGLDLQAIVYACLGQQLGMGASMTMSLLYRLSMLVIISLMTVSFVVFEILCGERGHLFEQSAKSRELQVGEA